MSAYQHMRRMWQPEAPSPPPPPTPTPTPTPTGPRFQVDQPAPRRWVRVAIFPRNTHARLRYVPLSPQTLGHTREEALTRNLWTCRTSFMRTEVVRVKHSWESNWSYYEIKIAVPIIPGFGRSNAALLPLRECPEFTGEVVVMRRTGPRLTRVADMRLEDRRKVEIAIISIIRSSMGMDARYRGNLVVQYMMSFEALDSL